MKRLIGWLSFCLVGMTATPRLVAGGHHLDLHNGCHRECETEGATDLPGGCGECSNSYAFSLWADYCQTRKCKKRNFVDRCHGHRCGGASISCDHSSPGYPASHGIGTGTRNYPELVSPVVPHPDLKTDVPLAPPLAPPAAPADDTSSSSADSKAEIDSAPSNLGSSSETPASESTQLSPELPRNDAPADPQPAPNEIPPTDPTTKPADENRSAWFPRPRLRSLRP